MGSRTLLGFATLGLVLPLVIALAMATGAQASSRQTLVTAHNATRADMSRSALRTSPALSRTAQRRAERLARLGYLTHSSFKTALNRAGYYTGGENIAWAKAPVTTRAFMRMWRKSPPHARNLYDRRWTKIGIGLARSHGREYAVALFAR